MSPHGALRVAAPVLGVAAVQTAPVPGQVDRNASMAAVTARHAAELGARLIVFPELSLTGYDLSLLRQESCWLIPDDRRLTPLRNEALRAGTTIIVGAAYRDHTGIPRITSVAVTPDGGLSTVHKRHLHGEENDHFIPGTDELTIIDVEGWKIGPAVCFDAAVPAHAAALANAGAEVYAVSALYTKGQERRLDLHLGARAMDHRMYTILANLAGTGPDWQSCGGSGTWSPNGNPRKQHGPGETIIIDHLPRTGFTDWS